MVLKEDFLPIEHTCSFICANVFRCLMNALEYVLELICTATDKLVNTILVRILCTESFEKDLRMEINFIDPLNRLTNYNKADSVIWKT